MARINLEDSLFSDLRFLELNRKCHSTFEAVGLLIMAWKLAQTHFLDEENERLIPVEDWQRQRLGNVLLEVGFAEQKEKGIYVRGSEKQFAWLLQRSAAGQKTSERKLASLQRARDAKTNKTANGLNGTERNRTGLNGSEPLSPSLTHSLSQSHFSFSDSGSSSDSKQHKKTNTSPEQRELNKKIWTAYQEAYQSRYGVDPVRNASVNGKISQLAKRLGEESVDVVKFYLTHTESMYLKSTHAIGLCLRDCEALRTQMLRGMQITSRKVREYEKTETYNETLNAIRNGAI